LELVERREVLDERGIERTLTRLSAEILERAGGTASLSLVGIRTRGVPLAQRLAQKIREIEGRAPPQGAIDITLYRDDVFHGLPNPLVRSTEIPFDVKDRQVVLVDDVLFTGRTVRAALDALMDFGRPRAVRLAVLCDRGGRELPIHADHVGVTVETAANEVVKVLLREVDGVDRVVVRGVAR
jgi:pyrimidine operon attenuation protein/uracil phosphoribosyltransferase